MTTKEFNVLPKAEKAVLVARDILIQLELGKYLTVKGTYISNPVFKTNITKDDQISDIFDEMQQCCVCMLGAALLSCTHLGNQLTAGDIRLDEDECNLPLDNTKKINKLFKGIFTSKELLLIETCYENYKGKLYEGDFRYGDAPRYASKVMNQKLTYKEAAKCNSFYHMYPGSHWRMVAICTNIINNNGHFKI